MKKIISVLLITALVMTLFAGCGSNKAAEETNTEIKKTTEENNEATAKPVEVTIWHDKGDSGTAYFKVIEEEVKKTHPEISINAVTYDTETWKSKSLAAATQTGGVDLIFNDASRILELHLASGEQFDDLSDVLSSMEGKEFVLEGDKMLSSFKESLVVLPINRTLAALGVRTDLFDVKQPKTWASFVETGKRFKESGIAGFTMHLGKDPGQIFNLFMNGSGYSDLWLNEEPTAQIKNNIDNYMKIISIYNKNVDKEAFWDVEAINQTFAEMYQVIEGGNVGMFRVGNWNAPKWDKEDHLLSGKYKTYPWPALNDGDDNYVVQLNARGFAMPSNSEHKDAAKEVLKVVLGETAQYSSFDNFGSVMRAGLDLKLSPNQEIFFDANVKIKPIDNYFAQYGYYNKLNEAYEKSLTNAFYAESKDKAIEILTKATEEIDKLIKENK